MAAIKILVLGSGMVARPCVEYLVRDPKNHVTVGKLAHYSLRWMTLLRAVACRTLPTAQSLASSLPRTQAISLDVSKSAELEKAISTYDLVISLVPYIHHVAVIKLAIKYKINVVTASYVSPAIRELEAAAKEAGIVILNEVGYVPLQEAFGRHYPSRAILLNLGSDAEPPDVQRGSLCGSSICNQDYR